VVFYGIQMLVHKVHCLDYTGGGGGGGLMAGRLFTKWDYYVCSGDKGYFRFFSYRFRQQKQHAQKRHFFIIKSTLYNT
jgi:hypothetical protein